MNSILKNNMIVGAGWGMSVTGMVKNFFSTQNRDVLFVPAMGCMNELEHIYNLPEIVRNLAAKVGGSFSPLYAPAIVDSQEIRDSLLNDSSIQKTTHLWPEIDILVIGIGALKTKMPQSLKSYLHQNSINLQESGIVCDLCFNFFDKDGNHMPTELNNRMIGISYEQIKKTPLVVAIASGQFKAQAIKAALLSGCINVLITDELTALSIIKNNE